MGHAIIQNIEFTLFYDYDKSILKSLSIDGKADWLSYRLESFFLKPLEKIFDQDSDVFRELNNDAGGQYVPDFWTFMIAAFSVLLNGIEALGSFLVEERDKQKKFRTFIQKYMNEWDIQLSNLECPDKAMWLILWKYYRNGIAHGFRIEYGGIEIKETNIKFEIKNGVLQINPIRFFHDFKNGKFEFFRDLKNKDEVDMRNTFIKRFAAIYPHKI